MGTERRILRGRDNIPPFLYSTPLIIAIIMLIPTCYKEVIMPAYEYVCRDCNHDITVFLSLKELEAKPKIKCPHCESDNLQRKISAFTAKTSKKS
jgi:putative FmdB family regulatory protein